MPIKNFKDKKEKQSKIEAPQILKVNNQSNMKRSPEFNRESSENKYHQLLDSKESSD